MKNTPTMENKNGTLLWVDDEIDLLRAHILFLENKGYEVDTVTNGHDALGMCRERQYDLVLLDEHMVGMSGLETLRPSAPRLPITSSSRYIPTRYCSPSRRTYTNVT